MKTQANAVLITDGLAPKGVELLEQNGLTVDMYSGMSPEELLQAVKKGYGALIVRSGTNVTHEVLEAANGLQVIGRAGTGLDNVDVECASKRGVIVMNAPEGNTISTAEHTMSMLLSLAKRIPQASGSVRSGKWERRKFMGVELYGKVLGIIGLGRVGGEVAARARAFHMQVIAYDPFLTEERAGQLETQLVGLDELLEQADFISMHTPLTADTEGLIGADELKKIKRGVRIVNCSRGGSVDETALLAALESGQVAGAALDVFAVEPPVDNPLLDHPEVIASPHLGGSTEEAQEHIAEQIASQICDALQGGSIRNAVNYPSVSQDVLALIGPYISLAERLGLFVGQLCSGPIQEVHVRYKGEVTNHQLAPVTVATLKGLLAPSLGETVNYVNASVIAQERAIKVVESKTTEAEDFANLVVVEVQAGEGTHVVMGTLFVDRLPRLVKVDEYYVEAVPEGTMIVSSNDDVPGIVGMIGTVLGQNQINIAGMSMGRDKPGGKAVTVINVDGEVNNAVQQELLEIKHVRSVQVVTL